MPIRNTKIKGYQQINDLCNGITKQKPLDKDKGKMANAITEYIRSASRYGYEMNLLKDAYSDINLKNIGLNNDETQLLKDYQAILNETVEHYKPLERSQEKILTSKEDISQKVYQSLSLHSGEGAQKWRGKQGELANKQQEVNEILKKNPELKAKINNKIADFTHDKKDHELTKNMALTLDSLSGATSRFIQRSRLPLDPLEKSIKNLNVNSNLKKGMEKTVSFLKNQHQLGAFQINLEAAKNSHSTALKTLRKAFAPKKSRNLLKMLKQDKSKERQSYINDLEKKASEGEFSELLSIAENLKNTSKDGDKHRQVDEYKKNVEALQAAYGKEQEFLQKYSTAKEDLAEHHVKVKEEYVQKIDEGQKKLESLDSKISHLNRLKEGHNEQILQLNQELTEKQNSLEQKNNILEKRAKEKVVYHSKHSELETKVANVLDKIEKGSQRIENFHPPGKPLPQEQIQQMSLEDKLDKLLERYKTRIETLASNATPPPKKSIFRRIVTGIRRIFNPNYQDSVDKKHQKMLKEGLQEVNKLINEREIIKQQAELNIEEQNLQGRLKFQEKEIEAMSDVIDGIKGEIEGIDSEILELKERIEQEEGALEQCNNEHSETLDKKSDLESEIKTYEQEQKNTTIDFFKEASQGNTTPAQEKQKNFKQQLNGMKDVEQEKSPEQDTSVVLSNSGP